MEKQLNNMQQFIFAGKPILMPQKHLKCKKFMATLLYIMLVFHWYNAFSEGRELICDEQSSGRPTTTRMCENIARVADI